ncbi:MAG: TfoX/Sxy family protein [Promethearchaeota archaeon]
MVYNEKMDQKLNAIISNWKNYSIKKMFGGTGYLLDGKMVAGVYKDYYILRLGERNATAAFKLPKIKAFDITGRPMKSWIMAEEDTFPTGKDLLEWLKKAKEFVKSL